MDYSVFTNMYLQIIKGIPWWMWILIVIGILGGASEKKRYRRRKYNNYKNDDGLLGIVADWIINSIKGMFKPKIPVVQQHYPLPNVYPPTTSSTNIYTPTTPVTNNNVPKNEVSLDSNISDIDMMTGRDFEKYLEKLFLRLGYRVNRVGTCYYDHRGDFGADLIVEKDNIRTALQAKRYSKYVGISSVREVMGAVSYYKCQKAIVITNKFFTHDAKTQAFMSRVELWNRYKLINVMKSIQA